MADFTIRLKDILNVDRPKDHDPTLIGLDDYPIWSEGYRSQLNTKIVRRFWNREIAHETPDMFRFRMDTVMNEIMPYYVRLFKTTFEFDPFETVDLTIDNEGNVTSAGSVEGAQHGTDTVEGTTEGSTKDTTTAQEHSESESGQQSASEAVAIASEYPNTRIVDGEHYATSSNESKSESDSTSTATSDGTSTTESEGEQSGTTHQTGENTAKSEQTTDQTQDTTQQQKTRGFQGNKSELIQQYRDTLIGVDNQILAELDILFMGIWDTGSAYNRLENTHYPMSGYYYGY